MILGAAVGSVLLGFPFGVWVGYMWRDRISRARRSAQRTKREQQRMLRELNKMAAPLSPRDDFF
jgi:hypothetical protein